MTAEPTKKRPEQSVDDAQAAFTRLQKLTKALLGVDKTEYDQKRTEYGGKPISKDMRSQQEA